MMALLALAPACKAAKESPPAGGAPPAESGAPTESAAVPAAAGKATAAEDGNWKEIPNISGFVAEVPPDAIANDVGGAAGFHTDNNSFDLTFMETAPEEAAKDRDTVKKDAEQVLFKKWIKSEPTPDGWVLAWEGTKVDASGEEVKELGAQYSFQVRRKIADKTYTCYGALDKADGLDVAVKSCLSVKAK